MAKKNKTNKFPYSTFVKDDDDLKGIVAYSIYKRAKIEFRTKLDGERLTELEFTKRLEEWKAAKLLDSQVEQINEAAEQYLNEYVEHYKDSHFPWRNSILSSIYATAIVTVVTILLSIGIACYNKFNPFDLLRKAANQTAAELTQPSND